MRVAIVGGGLMGLCLARSLCRDGHLVSVYEQGPLPNPAASSFDAHRLIRSAYGPHSGYGRMVREAYEAWQRLWEDLGASHFVPTGTLLLGDPASEWNTASIRFLRSRGIQVRTFSGPALVEAYPFLRSPAYPGGCLIREGGVLFADRILLGLCHWLQGNGVHLLPRSHVTHVDARQGFLVCNGDAAGPYDILLITAGAWTNHLFDSAPLPFVPTRQVIGLFCPPDAFRTPWAGSPMFLDIGPGEGFYAVPPVDGTPLKIGSHRFGPASDPATAPPPAPAEIDRVRNLAAGRLRDFDDYGLEKARVCHYATTPEERFILEKRGRAWILAGFSGHGFKFGPLIGEQIARAVTSGLCSGKLIQWVRGF